ncbi:MAG: hypothetical protein ACOYJY_02540, partial [Acutalibacteraceae bacterium]|jgi:MYXO-CTERM domain-containing protein
LFTLPGMANETVLINTMNYINGNDDALSIPSQDLTQDVLQFSEGGAGALNVIFTYVLPLGLLVIGLVVFLRRRHL